MYKLLIVDDERYAVQSLKSGVDWAKLGIGEVHVAYNVKEAMAIFETTPIDVMLCDIEMPKGTGLELTAWVNETSPATETIFLTCHADFSFAQQAIKLNSFDYLLKPVDYGVLEATVAAALESIKDERNQEKYKTYYDLWQTKKSVLTEKFWQDLFARRIAATDESLPKLADEYQLPLTPDSRVLPVFISIERWNKHLDARDEEVMEYALRNAAAELLLTGGAGEAVQVKSGINVAVLYSGEAGELPEREELRERCRSYIQACATYFYCEVSCYVGLASAVAEASKTYAKLLDMEYNNVNKAKNVYFMHDVRDGDRGGDGLAASVELPVFSAWAALIEQGNKSQVDSLIAETCGVLSRGTGLSARTLGEYYDGLLQMIHYVLQKKGLSAYDRLTAAGMPERAAATRSVAQLEAWAHQVVAAVLEEPAEAAGQDSIIQRVKQYVADHLREDISREDLASHVFVNPAYLSRLFKKETGESLTDYILRERMKQAKELIVGSTMPVSDIALSLGYSNFSYFSKMFKKVYGMNPQHYRRASRQSVGL